MGDYTTVRFDVKLSEQGEQRILRLHALRREAGDMHLSIWARLAHEERDVLEKEKTLPSLWLWDQRADFIPFGGVSYYCWGKGHCSDVVVGRWRCLCSVKGTETTKKFLTLVLPLMIDEDCTVETWFELEDRPKTHTVRAEGKVS